MYENKLYDGFDQLIKSLFENEINIYLVTSKPTVYAKEILRHFKLQNYFKGVYGSELTIQNTSKVDLIADTISNEKFNIENVIMIGDRNLDVYGAKANKICSAAVTFGYGSVKELQECEPDYIIDSVDGLYKLFK